MLDGRFEFRYRIGGEAPTVRRFRFQEGRAPGPGDAVNFTAGCVEVPHTGRERLLGVAVHRREADGRPALVEVITDGDAVYALDDPHARSAGATFGVTGPRAVAPHEDGQLVVVADCDAGHETLVRIRDDKHHVLARAALDAVAAVRARRRSGESPRGHLPPALERELVVAAAAGDRAATAQLVKSFLPAIAGVARLYRGAAGVDRTELLQEGVVGLLRALKRYDPALGTPFWAYASWWVRQAMQHLVADVARPTGLSDRALRGLARVKEARREHVQSAGREPSTDELAAATGMGREQVDSLLAIERTPRGLDERLGGEDGTAGTLGELLADPAAEDEYERVMERMEIEQVRHLSDGLGDREREIIFDHYGLGRPSMTLREIGDRLGVSAERVRQIEEQALAKLRAAVTAPPAVP